MIAYAAVLLMPVLFALLTRDNYVKYRVSTDAQRKIAKLVSDLPLLVTGVSLAVAAITQGFASEWSFGLSVMQRMEPALTELSTLIDAKQCIPRRTSKNCFQAKSSLEEIRHQVRYPNSEKMRILLRELRPVAIMMTYDEANDVGQQSRNTIHSTISAMEEKLPPEGHWLVVFKLPAIILAITIFVVSGSMRVALSFVEWQLVESRPAFKF